MRVKTQYAHVVTRSVSSLVRVFVMQLAIIISPTISINYISIILKVNV